jgi:hypothetical protein
MLFFDFPQTYVWPLDTLLHSVPKQPLPLQIPTKRESTTQASDPLAWSKGRFSEGDLYCVGGGILFCIKSLGGVYNIHG